MTVKEAVGTTPTACAHAVGTELVDELCRGAGRAECRSTAAPGARRLRRRRGRPCRAVGRRRTLRRRRRVPLPRSTASCRASHHRRGSTSVPGGVCGSSLPDERAGVPMSHTTTLHDCVDESTPATRATVKRAPEHVLDHQLLDPADAVVPVAGFFDVEVLECRAVGEQVVRRLLAGQQGRGSTDPGPAPPPSALVHLGVRTERGRALLEQQVRPHVGRRRDPDLVERSRCAAACSRSGEAPRRPGLRRGRRSRAGRRGRTR